LVTVVSTLGETITSVPGMLKRKFRSEGKNFRKVTFPEQSGIGSRSQKNPTVVTTSKGGGTISQGDR